MTFRATTREQIRLVLRWVKEHPVLARNDNEVEKDGRELKTKLWKELTIQLNEIGPPVRTWMEWKRIIERVGENVTVRCCYCDAADGDRNIYRGSIKSTGNFLMHIKRKHPDLIQNVAKSKVIATLAKKSLQQDRNPERKRRYIKREVLTDYKYSLKKKIQRRIANTTHAGSEILASLSDLETEALQASLLDWDFGEGDKGLSETPPPPDGSQMSSDDMLQTSACESQESNYPTNPPPNINGSSTSVDAIKMEMVNGSNGNLNVQQINENSASVKMEENNFAPTHITPNGIIQMQQTASLPPENVAPAQENVTRLQQSAHTADMLNGAHYIKLLEDGTQEIQPLPFPVRQEIATSVPQIVQVSQTDNMLPTTAIVPSTVEVISSVQPATIPLQVISQPADTAETMNSVQLPQIQPTSEAPQPTMQQPLVQSQVQTQAQLTNEEMNKLIAREIDRMASTQKRKTTQRKRETRDKTREQKSSQSQSVQSSSSSTTQPKEKPRRTSEQTDRPKRQPPKRPRPKAIATASSSGAGGTKDGPRPDKRFLSSREFRHCLLQLLAEANEMEKRRIAITETKVRNQTEIQNLEITRMNLEIMKLQKEITLLDHGTKILP